MLGIPDGTQDAGAHVEDKDKQDSGKIDPKIQGGIRNQFSRRIHPFQQIWRKEDAGNGDGSASQYRKSVGRMQAFLHRPFVPGPIKLRDDDGGAGGKPGEKSDHQVDDLGGGPSYAGKGTFSDKVPYNDRINRII